MAQQLGVLQAAQTLLPQLGRTLTPQSARRRQADLGLPHPTHQGADLTVTQPGVVMEIELPEV